MQPWISTFKQLWKQMCLMLKILIRGKRLVRTLPLYPILLKKKRPLLSVAPSLGLYSTTVQLRASGLRNGKWGNGHLHSKRETNGPKKTIDRLQYSHYMGTQVFEHLLCKQITMYQDRILYPRMTAYEEAEGRLQSQT